MKKVFFITTVILAAFANRSTALNKPITGNYAFIADTVKPKAKADTITPVIIKHATVAMSTKQLNHILNVMRQKRNDTQKIRVLKPGIKNKGLMLAQLTILLNQFLNDASKLSCAEYAYPNTIDYQGFGALDNIFSTQDSKDKLDDFLKRNK